MVKEKKNNMAKITNFQFIIHKNTIDDINNTIELSKLVNGENKYADNNSSWYVYFVICSPESTLLNSVWDIVSIFSLILSPKYIFHCLTNCATIIFNHALSSSTIIKIQTIIPTFLNREPVLYTTVSTISTRAYTT